MDNRYQIGTEENRAFLERMREEMFAFGRRFPSPSGSSYYLGGDGTPMKEHIRETWITSRMAHVYSLAFLLGHSDCGDLADAALSGLRSDLHDDVHDGWYAGVTADGGIVPGKQCYAHAFVILAASSGLLAGREGSRELLDHALAVYDRYFWNEEEGLAADLWDTDFQVCDDYRGLNANMHSVEAFLAAADVLGDETYRIRAGRIIDHTIGWAKEFNWRLPEHFSKDWEPQPELNADRPDDPFKPYGATPGHGIEWARLILQWALSALPEEERAPYLEASEALYDRAVQDAWFADGEPGIVYTTDWNGKPVVHDRMHWTLMEAINSSASLFRVTGNPRYARDYAAFMEYLDQYVYDHVNGSCFHQLDEHNRLKETVWPGKSDLYHAVQATLISGYDPSVSIAAAVAEKG